MDPDDVEHPTVGYQTVHGEPGLIQGVEEVMHHPEEGVTAVVTEGQIVKLIHANMDFISIDRELM